MEKTTFISNNNLYRFLPFCLAVKNALSWFNQSILILLSIVMQNFALVCLDDIFIFSRFIKEFWDHVRRVLGFLSISCVSLQLNECFLFEDPIDCLGQDIQPGRLAISRNATNAVARLQYLTYKTELKSFFGIWPLLLLLWPNFTHLAPLQTEIWKTTNCSNLVNRKEQKSSN